MTATLRTAGRAVTRRIRLLPQRFGPLAHPRGRQVELILVVLVLAVALIASGVWVLYHQLHRAEMSAQARSSAVEAARSHAQQLLSYDYRSFDKDIDQAKNSTTGTFRKNYLETTRNLVANQAKQNEVVVRARVVGASVVDAEPDRVVTLLLVNQATQSNRVDGTEVDKNRVRMTLTKVDGQWLASDLAAL